MTTQPHDSPYGSRLLETDTSLQPSWKVVRAGFDTIHE